MRYWHRPCDNTLLIAHPVGDGNALELQSSWDTALIDCGGDCRASQVLHSASARGMSKFLLTHLHYDHYSGVSKQPTASQLSCNVDHVFLPALPLIGDRTLTKEFALALFTMNAILGEKSGIPEQDLIDKFTSLNPSGSKPHHSFLSEGDSFDLAGIPFQVLWPPRAVSGLVAQSAKDAVDEFRRAIEGDERAREIRDRLKTQASHVASRAEQRAEQRPDRHVDDRRDFIEDTVHPDDSNVGEEDNYVEHEVPEVLRDSNKAIRKVANRLSLAFRCGTRLIHLGDLENAELDRVVTDLRGATHYFGMIASHHGTHFSSKMKSLRVLNLVVCNGPQRPSLKTGYRSIARLIQETNVHGHSFLLF